MKKQVYLDHQVAASGYHLKKKTASGTDVHAGQGVGVEAATDRPLQTTKLGTAVRQRTLVTHLFLSYYSSTCRRLAALTPDRIA
jgi:hypothetical protein